MKDNLIRKNPNLTEEQKQEIIAVLTRHLSSENLIDWNRNSKLTYEDFLTILRPLYINDLDFRGLVEGEDYDILLDKPNEKLYAVYTYEASKILASNSVEPKIWTEIPEWCGEEEFKDEAHAFGSFDSEHRDMKPGAKWCISMQTSNELWNDYSKNFYFIFWLRDDESLGDNQKIALGIDINNGEIANKFNASDSKVSLNIPQYIEDTINESFNTFEKKRKQVLLSRFKLHPETGRYDYDGDLGYSILKDFISEDKDGFTINFGRITGNFSCSFLGLTSLKGSPQDVGGYFSCSNNRLTSLKGAPQTVGGYFNCTWNQLTSLEGAPEKVGEDFYCYNNELTSLEGAPKIIGESFSCSSNKLISLEGAPKIVGGSFYCYWNQLTSLEGAPQTVDGDFGCFANPNLLSLDGIGKVKGRIYKDY